MDSQKNTMDRYCIAQGTLLNVMWQPGWEGSFWEGGYTCMYDWVPLLATWNYHNTVNLLHFNIKAWEKKKNQLKLDRETKTSSSFIKLIVHLATIKLMKLGTVCSGNSLFNSYSQVKYLERSHNQNSPR